MQARFIIAVATAIGLITAGALYGLRRLGSGLDARQAGSTPIETTDAGRDPVYQGPVWFCEVTDQAGIDFRHNSGDSPEKPFPSANGSGVAALDYDLDGLYDLYFVTGTRFPVDLATSPYSNRFYRNRGGWRFEDVTRQCHLAYNGYSHGVAVGDYDNDGFPDVYVSCFGANCLFHNQGDGTFLRIEQTANVADDRWGGSAAFFDYDSDGLLDLYVCNYAKWSLKTNAYCGDRARGVRLFCSPLSVKAEADVLYRNAGNGTFQEVTEDAGLASRDGRALAAIAVHLNEDALIDLYVTNDLHANSLFLNEGNGRFRDESEMSGAAYDSVGSVMSSMGVDAADMDGNGRFDLIVTHFQGEYNVLYRNLDDGMFYDVSRTCGLAAPSMPFVGWGVVLADFDLDGWSDAVVTNGHVDDNRQHIGESVSLTQRPLALRNVEGAFEVIGPAAGPYFVQEHGGRGLTVADLDNDGDWDAAFNHRDGPAAVLRNDRAYPQSGQRRSITLRLVGTRGNRDAIGSSITLRADGRTKIEQIMGGGSYASARDLRQVFAVAAEENEVGFEIRWPDGKRSALSEIQPGNTYVVIEPAVEARSPRVLAMQLPH